MKIWTEWINFESIRFVGQDRRRLCTNIPTNHFYCNRNSLLLAVLDRRTINRIWNRKKEKTTYSNCFLSRCRRERVREWNFTIFLIGPILFRFHRIYTANMLLLLLTYDMEEAEWISRNANKRNTLWIFNRAVRCLQSNE